MDSIQIVLADTNSLIWIPVALILALIAIGWTTRFAWRVALQHWEHPHPPKPSQIWWMDGWMPFVLLAFVFGVFVFCNVVRGDANPIPPDRKWVNVLAWLFGSSIGGWGGWVFGKKLAGRDFTNDYPTPQN